jgi:hypothetical protein
VPFSFRCGIPVVVNNILNKCMQNYFKLVIIITMNLQYNSILFYF